MSIRARLLLTALFVTVVATAAGTLLVHEHLSAAARQRSADTVAAKVALVEAALTEETARGERAASAYAGGATTLDLNRRGVSSDIEVWSELQLARDLADVDELQVLDGRGDVLLRVGDPVHCDAVLAHPLVRDKLLRGVGSWWIRAEDHAMHVALAPITEEDRRLGLVLASHPLQSVDQLAERVDADLALLDGEELLDHSLTPEVTPIVAGLLGAPTTTAPRRVAVAGRRYQVQEVALGAGPARDAMRLVVLCEAERPTFLQVPVLGRLVAVGLGGLAAAWLILLLVSRSITLPLHRLEAFARRAADGQPRPVQRHSSAPEIAVVEDALNDWLRQELRNRELHEGEIRDTRDREIDRWIQASTTPDDPGFEDHDLAVGSWRGEEAGGDLCALLPAPNGSLWIAVGTVSTRGLRAGMLTTLLTGALETAVQISPGSPPTVVLRALDGLLTRYAVRVGWDDSFAGLRLVRLAPDGGVAFAGAQSPMWLARADGSACTTHDWTGVWIGLAAEQDDPDGKLMLGPGDTLLLATPGLTAAQDESGRFLGSAGVTAILDESRGQPARVIRDRLMTRWTEWVCDPGVDTTAVVIRRRTGAPAAAP